MDPPQNPPYNVVAKANFNPEAGALQQLTLRDGDQVKINHDAQNGWLGSTKLDGTTGWLPKLWVRYVPGLAAPHPDPQPSLQQAGCYLDVDPNEDLENESPIHGVREAEDLTAEAACAKAQATPIHPPISFV